MKVGVIVFPGSNCDEDMAYVFRDILKVPTVKLWHKSHDLEGCTHLILPGGFSYGDYLRSGSIARFSPIMHEVVEHARKGKFVFGVCNGFQILCEAGLLPGALLQNLDRKFICDNVYIKPENTNTQLTCAISENNVLKIPIAHGEGRFYAPDDMLNEILDNNQILFKYCDRDGNVTHEANPNGSLLNIAGICNKTRNVFGMMPHPERAADAELFNEDGKFIFESILKSVHGELLV